MRQTLHLLAIDPDRAAVLTTMSQPKWLLPVMCCEERARATVLAARWCARHGVRGDVVGQWLGSIGTDGADWLVVARSRSTMSPDSLRWTSVESLRSATALLPYQGWALDTVFYDRGTVPVVTGPFGNVEWIDRVRAWLTHAGYMPDAFVPYRLSPHEVVLGVRVDAGQVYFKGLIAERATEVALTRALAQVEPESFAPSLAIECRRDGSVWWLTAACPGLPARTAAAAATALARLQQRILTAGPSAFGLASLDLTAAVQWALTLVDDDACASRIRKAREELMRTVTPQTWIPMDLDRGNLIEDESGRVRFIDIDDSYLGAAPLAMAALAQRLPEDGALQIYADCWSPPIARTVWPEFAIMATVAQVWLGWKRLQTNVARGEVSVAAGVVEHRLRALLRRSLYRG